MNERELMYNFLQNFHVCNKQMQSAIELVVEIKRVTAEFEPTHGMCVLTVTFLLSVFQYLSTPESQSLRCDLIRYICCVFHPSNELLCSDIIPRWAVIGWLLQTCTVCTHCCHDNIV